MAERERKGSKYIYIYMYIWRRSKDSPCVSSSWSIFSNRGDRPWKCSKRSNRMDEGTESGASAFEADENKDPEATGVPLAVFASLGWRCDKKKEKKRKEKEGDGRQEGRGVGTCLLRFPGYRRSIRWYVSLDELCVYTRIHVSSVPCTYNTYVRVDEGLHKRRPRIYVYIYMFIYIYIKRTYKRAKKRGLVARRKIYISAYERRSKWLRTGYIRLIGRYSIYYSSSLCSETVYSFGWLARYADRRSLLGG